MYALMLLYEWSLDTHSPVATEGFGGHSLPNQLPRAQLKYETPYISEVCFKF